MRQKHKSIVRIIIFMLLFCMMLPMTSFAFNGNYNKSKIETYAQGWNGVPWASSPLKPGSGSTFQSAGCGWMSHYFMLIASKCWKFPDKQPTDLTDEVAKIGVYSEDHYFPKSKINEIPGSKLQIVSENLPGGSGSPDSVAKVIEDAMINKGYFIIICLVGSQHNTGGHYVYIDNPNDGDWILGDSGRQPSIKWSDWYGSPSYGGISISHTQAYKLVDSSGKQIKWNEGYSMYDSSFIKSYLKEGRTTVPGTNETPNENPDDNTGKTPTQEESDKIASDAATVVQEWELEGMPEKSKLIQSRLTFEISDEDALGALGEDNVRVIGENIEARNKLTIPTLLHIILSVAGFILVIYGTLLILAYLFDLAYIGKRLSLLNILTFGKAAPQSRKDDVNAKKYLTGKGVIIRSVIIWICGLLLIRGNILLFVREILDFINSKIG